MNLITRITVAAVAGALVLVLTLNASAQDKVRKDLTLDIQVKKEVKVQKNGKWIIEHQEVGKVRKNDILVYTIKYSNRHEFEVKNAAIIDPVPDGTEYIIGSAAGEGSDITCSINGGKDFQSLPAVYTVIDGDGNEEEVRASASMYTHIKWLIKGPVPPGGYGEVSFKVKVK